MSYVSQKIINGVYGFALWSKEWGFYINCYVIKDDLGFTLIDTGKEENKEELITLLNYYNIKLTEIHTIIFTHGHKDHIGNYELFANAKKFIHKNDKHLVGNTFNEITQDMINGLEIIHIGTHTLGSIALYHKIHKILFIGDEVNFGGFSIADNKLIQEANDLREILYKNVTSIEYQKFIQKKNIKIENLIESLIFLSNYDIKYLCSGHGIVLENNIPLFLKTLSLKYSSII